MTELGDKDSVKLPPRTDAGNAELLAERYREEAALRPRAESLADLERQAMAGRHSGTSAAEGETRRAIPSGSRVKVS